MKKYFMLTIVFLLALSLSLNAQTKTIAVLPFTGIAEQQANLLAGMLGTELRKNGNYQIAPRTPAIAETFKEQSVQRQGLTDTMTISELGKGANASYVVSAHVHSIGKQKVIAASIIDVESFRQISGDYLTFNVEKEVIDYMPVMAKILLSGMSVNTSKLKTLAIFPVTSESEATATDRDILSQILSIDIANTGKYAVVIRTSSLSNVMKEQNIQRQGFTDEATVAEIGNAINANYVLYREVAKYGGEGYISTYVVDVAKKTQEIGAYASYKEIDNIIPTIPGLTHEITGSVNKKKLTILLDAYKGKKGISDMQKLFKKGNINEKGKGGTTILMLAAENGHVEIVKNVIAMGVDIDAKDSNGYTALGRAVGSDEEEVIDILLISNADINESGALILAAEKGQANMVTFLLSKNANVNSLDKNDETALMAAVRKGNLQIAKILIEKGADLETRTTSPISGIAVFTIDSTPLFVATFNGDTEIVKLLIAAGANLNSRTKGGATAYMCARQTGRKEIAEILKNAGANTSMW